MNGQAIISSKVPADTNGRMHELQDGNSSHSNSFKIRCEPNAASKNATTISNTFILK